MKILLPYLFFLVLFSCNVIAPEKNIRLNGMEQFKTEDLNSRYFLIYTSGHCGYCFFRTKELCDLFTKMDSILPAFVVFNSTDSMFTAITIEDRIPDVKASYYIDTCFNFYNQNKGLISSKEQSLLFIVEKDSVLKTLSLSTDTSIIKEIIASF